MSDIRFAAPSDLTDLLCAFSTADALIKYGALLVKDSRVSEEDNATFLDLLEDYFVQDNETLLKDTRPEFGYQGGLDAHAHCVIYGCLTIDAQSERRLRTRRSRDARSTPTATLSSLLWMPRSGR